MADHYLGPHLAFDRGIERVTYARQGDVQSLPQREEGSPSELGGRPQLETMLAQPTLDGLLEDAIRPQLENRELLVPSRFQASLDSVHAALSAKIGDAANAQVGTLPPKQERIIRRAVRLLASERDLRSLVQMYRSVLYQG